MSSTADSALPRVLAPNWRVHRNHRRAFSTGRQHAHKRHGAGFIAEAFEEEPKSLTDLVPPPDRKSSTGRVWAYGKIRRIIRSPVLSQVLCSTGNQFSFNPRSVILARLNRAELGGFDALELGLFLMSHFRGQICVPDFGSYGRDSHVSLIREEGMIAGATSESCRRNSGAGVSSATSRVCRPPISWLPRV
jgi:hypothetical protein